MIKKNIRPAYNTRNEVPLFLARMFSIYLDWVVGNSTKKLNVSQPYGSAGVFHIMIDNYFQGQMFKVQQTWRGYFNSMNFGPVEIEFIGEAIDKSQGSSG